MKHHPKLPKLPKLLNDPHTTFILNDVNVAIKPIREQARKTKTPRKRFLQGGV